MKAVSAVYVSVSNLWISAQKSAGIKQTCIIPIFGRRRPKRRQGGDAPMLSACTRYGDTATRRLVSRTEVLSAGFKSVHGAWCTVHRKINKTRHDELCTMY